MTRNHRSAKAAGSRFERSIADYLRDFVDDRIDRRVKTGAKDRGDIGGLRSFGNRVVVETKDYGGQLKPGPWMDEAELERGHDDATVALVVAKRRGKTDPADQWVLMTMRDLVAVLTGQRPEEET